LVIQGCQKVIDQIHELILEDRRISAKSVAEQLGISRERVGSIIHEDLDMLVACFLPGRAKDYFYSKSNKMQLQMYCCLLASRQTALPV
jgi:DNA-binding transcriptional regulator GbsR (MarR family)